MLGKWVAIATLACTLTLPAIAAVADEAKPSWQQSPAASNPKPTESSDGTDTISDDSNGIEGSPIDTYLDTDKTRENLESRYENPADVALPPKLLIPRASSSKSAGKSNSSTFNVYQLQHNFPGPKPPSTTAQLPKLQVVQTSTSLLRYVPLDINNAVISFKTPAQEFFDGASSGLLVLATSAVSLGAAIIIRSKRKDHHH